MVPHLVTALSGPINELEQRILDATPVIERWFRLEWMEHTPPLYCSVDIRNAGFKLAPVDTNLYPDGWHNLSADVLPLAVQAAQAAIEKICPEARNLMIVPENGKPSSFYLASLARLQDIFRMAGLNVRFGSIDPAVKTSTTLKLPDGEKLVLEPALRAWADGDPRRLGRAETLFALTPERRWNEERVLERYELLYEAGLVAESARDHDRPASPVLPDLPMASDHRRIVATALGRLRSKLKYRPVLFDLTPDTFTLSALQAAAEAVAGLSLHKQNFRRGVERAGLVQATGVFSSDTGGRPAELFRFVGIDPLGGPAPGLTLPGQR